MRARDITETVVPFLTSCCFAYLALIHADVPIWQRATPPPDSDTDYESTINYSRFEQALRFIAASMHWLMRHSYQVVQWMIWLAQHVSVPFAVPAAIAQRKWLVDLARFGWQAFAKKQS